MIIKQTIPDLADSLVIPLENTIQKLNKEIVDLNKEYQEQINDLNESYQDQIDNLNSEHELEVCSLNDTINELNDTISIKDSEISNLNSEVDYLSKKQFPDIDGISFAYSKFEGELPPSIVEYLNTHKLDAGYALSQVTCNSLPDKHLKLYLNTFYQALYMFMVSNQYDNELTIDCSRINDNLIQLHTVLRSSTFNKINVVNSSKIFRYIETFNIGSDCEVRGLDFAGVTYSQSNPFIQSNWVFKVYCDNIGMQSTNTSLSFKECARWGVTIEDHPLSIGAKESLIYSLIDHSFDRASAGYPTCTISLYTYTKEVLTDEEIAQITAKGFTIA